jgi:hypothetical protein
MYTVNGSDIKKEVSIENNTVNNHLLHKSLPSDIPLAIMKNIEIATKINAIM